LVNSEELERFAVTPPAQGTLRIASDVMVRYAGNEWIAISHEPAVKGEIAQLGFGGPESLLSFDVTVLESCPTIVGHAVRHRLRLSMPGPARGGTSGKGAHERFQSGWAAGVLTRDLEVRLLAFSKVGCALESDGLVRASACGHLRVALGGIDFVDDVEIVICTPRGVGSACELGAMFCSKASASDLSHHHPQAEGLEGLVRGLTTSNVH
jgi:hypothetical protein